MNQSRYAERRTSMISSGFILLSAVMVTGAATSIITEPLQWPSALRELCLGYLFWYAGSELHRLADGCQS
jgi:hypothetical protein